MFYQCQWTHSHWHSSFGVTLWDGFFSMVQRTTCLRLWLNASCCVLSCVPQFFSLHLLRLWGTNALCFARLMKPCWEPREKQLGSAYPLSLFLFLSLFLSVFFSHSPPTVVFAPIVTTQQPALTSSDWWISCDGGGLSERDLSASKQLSFPIHIPSSAGERAGAASALAATAAKAKTFCLWMSSLWSATRTTRWGAAKDLNIHKSHCFLSFSLFSSVLLFVFDQQKLKYQRGNWLPSQNSFQKHRGNNLEKKTCITTSLLWISSVLVSVCLSLPDRAPTKLCVRVWGV